MKYKITEIWAPKKTIYLPKGSIVLKYEHLLGTEDKQEHWYFVYLEPETEE